MIKRQLKLQGGLIDEYLRSFFVDVFHDAKINRMRLRDMFDLTMSVGNYSLMRNPHADSPRFLSRLWQSVSKSFARERTDMEHEVDLSHIEDDFLLRLRLVEYPLPPSIVLGVDMPTNAALSAMLRAKYGETKEIVNIATAFDRDIGGVYEPVDLSVVLDYPDEPIEFTWARYHTEGKLVYMTTQGNGVHHLASMYNDDPRKVTTARLNLRDPTTIFGKYWRDFGQIMLFLDEDSRTPNFHVVTADRVLCGTYLLLGGKRAFKSSTLMGRNASSHVKFDRTLT